MTLVSNSLRQVVVRSTRILSVLISSLNLIDSPDSVGEKKKKQEEEEEERNKCGTITRLSPGEALGSCL